MPQLPSHPVSYIGRFAPSPTGPLHLGSLLAALASYLDAHSQQGKWLLRIEDTDPPREQPGAASSILRALEAHGLTWNDTETYQSQRANIYREAADSLVNTRLAYYCSCSRQQLKEHPVYPGTCRNQFTPPDKPAAIRILTRGTIHFMDAIQGSQSHNMPQEIGDFVIYRKDQLVAYQLATALDDALQGITHVVRGCDLLDSTPRQIYLQQALGLNAPSYAHIPVLAHSNGQKLSKQNLAKPLDPTLAQQNLFMALNWLNQQPPDELARQPIDEILAWGIQHWQREQIPRTQAITIAPETANNPIKSGDVYF
jgi:glutamyl-Q tRNA(Asp) synthetase